MTEQTQKKIWIRLQRKYLELHCRSQEMEDYCIEIKENDTGQQIKETIMKTCHLCNLDNIVLKLRNHRGSLIPITWNIPANSNFRPHILEVVKEHQNVKAQPRSITIKTYSETVKDKLNDITQRIEKLEDATPDLNERRNDKINKEMKEVEQMLEFITKRMHDAENASWKGMFKKNPLW